MKIFLQQIGHDLFAGVFEELIFSVRQEFNYLLKAYMWLFQKLSVRIKFEKQQEENSSTPNLAS